MSDMQEPEPSDEQEDMQDDVFVAEASADTFDGTDDNRTVSYKGSNEGVTISLDEDEVDDDGYSTGSGGYAEGDKLKDIEHIVGSDHDDMFIGSDDDDFFEGGAGNDTLIGGAGADTLTGGAGADNFAIYLAGAYLDTVTDFTKGEDKLLLDVADPSAVTSFAFANLVREVENGNTYISRGGDLIMILTGVTDELDFATDVEVI